MYNQCCSVIPFFWNTSCLQTSCYIHFHLKKYLNKRVLNAAMDGIPLFWKQSIVIDKFCETYFFRGRVHFYSYTANLATEMQFKPLTLTCYVLWFLEYWHTNCRTEGCLMWIPQINIWLHSPLLFHCLFPFISSYTPSSWPLPPPFLCFNSNGSYTLWVVLSWKAKPGLGGPSYYALYAISCTCMDIFSIFCFPVTP